MAEAEGHRKLFPTDWSTYIHTSPIAQLLLLGKKYGCYDIDNTSKNESVIIKVDAIRDFYYFVYLHGVARFADLWWWSNISSRCQIPAERSGIVNYRIHRINYYWSGIIRNDRFSLYRRLRLREQRQVLTRVNNRLFYVLKKRQVHGGRSRYIPLRPSRKRHRLGERKLRSIIVDSRRERHRSFHAVFPPFVRISVS